MEKRRKVLNVAGYAFNITTDATDKELKIITDRIEMRINSFQRDSLRLGKEACAVLTALDLCDDAIKAEAKAKDAQQKYDEAITVNKNLREENDKYSTKIVSLEKEIENLKKELEETNSSLSKYETTSNLQDSAQTDTEALPQNFMNNQNSKGNEKNKTLNTSNTLNNSGSHGNSNQSCNSQSSNNTDNYTDNNRGKSNSLNYGKNRNSSAKQSNVKAQKPTNDKKYNDVKKGNSPKAEPFIPLAKRKDNSSVPLKGQFSLFED